MQDQITYSESDDLLKSKKKPKDYDITKYVLNI